MAHKIKLYWNSISSHNLKCFKKNNTARQKSNNKITYLNKNLSSLEFNISFLLPSKTKPL